MMFISSDLFFFFHPRWKRYRPLWKLDKTIMLEKFASKNPTCVAYDDKLQFYSKLATEVLLYSDTVI